MSDEPLLTAREIRKQFPGVLALDRVSVTVRAGEVLALVGENGAGKSTLMKILAGVYHPDGGELIYLGKPARFSGPLAAMKAGISLIHQELNLAENLTVQDNLFLGRETTFGGPLKLINNRPASQLGGSLLERVGLPTAFLTKVVGELPPGQKQLVEIARAIGLDAKLLIMDEPTSSLTQTETDRLYEVIAALKASGVSIVYISHRLAEIRRCADRAVILRDGRNAGELAKADITHANLVRMMVGRDLKQFFPRNHREAVESSHHAPRDAEGVDAQYSATTSGSSFGTRLHHRAGITRSVMPTVRRAAGETVLELDGLRYRGGPSHAASLKVKAGEVLGMAGLIGAGRTELSEAVFGLRSMTAGRILLNGEVVRIRKPADAIRAGILLVPEDRRKHGLVLEAAVGSNLSLPNLDRITRRGLLDSVSETKLHAESIEQLRVKTPSAAQPVGLLSGGNQQKVVFGKWLARNPKVLILDEPTRGVDVGAKTEIYTLIDELAGRGVAIWMITSDMEELLGVSDRAVVMHDGAIAGELARGELTEEAVMNLATGGGE